MIKKLKPLRLVAFTYPQEEDAPNFGAMSIQFHCEDSERNSKI